MHDALTVGIPVMAILLGIFLNRADVKDLRTEMNRRFDIVDRRFDLVDAELRYFHDTTGKLSGRVHELSKRTS